MVNGVLKFMVNVIFTSVNNVLTHGLADARLDRIG